MMVVVLHSSESVYCRQHIYTSLALKYTMKIIIIIIFQRQYTSVKRNDFKLFYGI
jgi:hypothetical protein